MCIYYIYIYIYTRIFGPRFARPRFFEGASVIVQRRTKAQVPLSISVCHAKIGFAYGGIAFGYMLQIIPHYCRET